MQKEDLKRFREHYFYGIVLNITESREFMCQQFKEYGLTERTARNWESGQRKISPWFIKVANDYDKDGVLK